MSTCPLCKVSFPEGINRCPNDGARLVASPEASPLPPAPAMEATQSLVAPLSDSFEAVLAHSPTAMSSPGEEGSDITRAERPQARARGSSSSHGVAEAKPAPPPAARRRSHNPTQPNERVGNVLGNYRLLELIGQGGMGCVYMAEHIKLGRQVALKLLRADHAERRDAVARFFQEARAVNKIRHRNIVDVTDFVELDDGTTFIIMELLDGMSLGKLSRSGDLPWPRALALLIQICDGLAAAHRAGIIHRDLKPDNIIVVPTGDGADLAKLLDFGVAKLVDANHEDLGYETAAGAVVGTPTFMSPEQAGGLDIDGRADIYSLGAIMYEVFTGQPVFTGRSFGEFVRKHLNEAPVPPSQTPGGRRIDDRLEGIILKCLEKQPNDRFSTVADLKDALLHLLGAIETSISSSSLIESGDNHFGANQRRSDPGISAHAIGSRPGSVDRARRSSLAPPAPGLVPAPRPQSSSLAPPASGLVPAPQPQSSSSGLRELPSGEISRPGGLHTSASRASRQSESDAFQANARNLTGPTNPTPWPAETAMTVGDLPAASSIKNRRRAPLFITGGIALGAIAGVVLYLTSRDREDDHAPPAPLLPASSDPVVTSLSDEAPVQVVSGANAAITIRFSSRPPGSVYRESSQEALCKTPCDIDVSEAQTYFIKRVGFHSERFLVDPAKPPRGGMYVATLRPIRSGSSGKREPEKPTPPPEKAETDPTDTTEPVRVEPTEDPPPGETKIDPTDTMDPFGRK